MQSQLSCNTPALPYVSISSLHSTSSLSLVRSNNGHMPNLPAPSPMRRNPHPYHLCFSNAGLIGDEHEHDIASHPFGSEPFRPYFDTYPPTTNAMSLLWEPMPAFLFNTMQAEEPIYTYHDTIVKRVIAVEGQLPTVVTFGTTFAIDRVSVHDYRHIAVRCLEKRGKWSLVELVPYAKDGRPKHRVLPTYIIVIPTHYVNMNCDGPRLDWWNEPSFAAQTTLRQRLRYISSSLPKHLLQLKRRINFRRSAQPFLSHSTPTSAGLVCMVEKKVVVH